MKLKDILKKANNAPLVNEPDRIRLIRFIKIAILSVTILFLTIFPLTWIILDKTI